MTTTERINPIKKKCRCGGKVTDHHFLCNKCWGKTAKRKDRQKKTKIKDDFYRAKRRKKREAQEQK